ncbi:coiled-coil domain-containing protein 157 [Eudromia elegans]
MAHLLGSPACMGGLRADLADLQGAIGDVLSRTGPVRYPSWKFPDRVSCELDLAELLERYDYVEGDVEFTQHAHVVLLELLVDRLLLLLQSFTGYAENLLGEKAVPGAQPVGPGMSAGLTVRKCWSSVLRLGALCQRLLAERKTSRKDNPAPKATREGVNTEKPCVKSRSPSVPEPPSSTGVAQSTSPCLLQSVGVTDRDVSDGSPRGAACSVTGSGRSIAVSGCSVTTQTEESPLAPCDLCAGAQRSLREVSEAIAGICQSQNIPSALSRFHETLEETLRRRSLSAMDMNYWASEQSKDLSRISKHLHMLLQLIDPLKSKLEEAEKQKEELQKKVEEFAKLLQEEKKTQEQQRKEAEQSLEAEKKEHLVTVAKLERDKEDLRRGATLLEERISTLKEALAAKQAALQELEVTKKTLLEDMRTQMVAKSQVLELQEKVQLLAGQQEGTGRELSAVTTQLEKEKAKVESMQRHEESLQAKQSALLRQLDSLDQEREELRASLADAEEDKARLAEQLRESRDKWEQSGSQLEEQQRLLDAVQQEKLALEQCVAELRANVAGLEETSRKLKERERLLVSFPELHVPVEAQFESTGNLAEDMEKQLQANNIRLSVLEQENVRLRAALAKVKVAAQQGVLKLVPQTQLWTQLSSRRGSEAGSQDPPRCPSGGSKEAVGRRRAAGGSHRRAPSGRAAPPRSAEPAGLLGGTAGEPRGSGSAARARGLSSPSATSRRRWELRD